MITKKYSWEVSSIMLRLKSFYLMENHLINLKLAYLIYSVNDQNYLKSNVKIMKFDNIQMFFSFKASDKKCSIILLRFNYLFCLAIGFHVWIDYFRSMRFSHDFLLIFVIVKSHSGWRYGSCRKSLSYFSRHEGYNQLYIVWRDYNWWWLDWL